MPYFAEALAVSLIGNGLMLAAKAIYATKLHKKQQGKLDLILDLLQRKEVKG